MSGVFEALIWASLILIISLVVIVQFGPGMREALRMLNAAREVDLKREELLLRERESTLSQMRDDLEIARQTSDERVMQAKAEAKQRAAEAEAATQLVAATDTDRLAAQRRIIAAEADARIAYIAANPGEREQQIAECLAYLAPAYSAYVGELDESDDEDFESWRGEWEWPLYPKLLEPLVEMYIAYIEEAEDVFDFDDWLGTPPWSMAKSKVSLAKV